MLTERWKIRNNCPLPTAIMRLLCVWKPSGNKRYCSTFGFTYFPGNIPEEILRQVAYIHDAKNSIISVISGNHYYSAKERKTGRFFREFFDKIKKEGILRYYFPKYFRNIGSAEKG